MKVLPFLRRETEGRGDARVFNDADREDVETEGRRVDRLEDLAYGARSREK